MAETELRARTLCQCSVYYVTQGLCQQELEFPRTKKDWVRAASGIPGLTREAKYHQLKQLPRFPLLWFLQMTTSLAMIDVVHPDPVIILELRCVPQLAAILEMEADVSSQEEL